MADDEKRKRDLLKIIARCHRKRMSLLRSELFDTQEYKDNDKRDREAIKEFKLIPKYDGRVRW